MKLNTPRIPTHKELEVLTKYRLEKFVKSRQKCGITDEMIKYEYTRLKDDTSIAVFDHHKNSISSDHAKVMIVFEPYHGQTVYFWNKDAIQREEQFYTFRCSCEEQSVDFNNGKYSPLNLIVKAVYKINDFITHYAK